MNYKLIAHYIGRVLCLLAVLMLLPLMIALFMGDQKCVSGFLGTITLTLLVGGPLGYIKCDKTKMYAKESFVIVAISWVAMSVLGAFPFLFSGQIPNYVDCLFESASGFTTTGASILPNVGVLSPSLLFWRAFTHWIGGMGILVFLMAVIPAVAGERSLHVMKAEAPGPSPGKLVPKMRQSSKILYIIYLALTLVQIPLLMAGGMPAFDSVVNALSTAGTGGFSAAHASFSGYNSFFCEVVITVFMLLFGINFNIFFFLLIRNFRGVLKSEELRVYLLIVAAAIALITWDLTRSGSYATAGESLRYASFQVSSYITTTGFTNITQMNWPLFSRVVLFVLMFIGGCSGSTAGGLKVSRIVLLVKESRRSLGQMIRPRTVELVKLDGKPVDKSVVHGVSVYLCMMAFIFFCSSLIISLENFDMETTLSAVAACLNNVGLGLGQIGPGGGFSGFSTAGKLVLTLNMLLGRLELYPILLLFFPRTWKKV